MVNLTCLSGQINIGELASMKLRISHPASESSSSHKYDSKFSGFTLTEVIIVLVLIGILSVFAVPRIYDHYTERKTKSAATQIATDIRFVQSLAITEHDSTWIEFDDNQHVYTLYSGETEATRTIVQYSSGAGAYIRTLNTGEFRNVTITGLTIGSDKSIAFDRFGNTNDSGSITLNNSVSITVSLGTGMVLIVEN